MSKSGNRKARKNLKEAKREIVKTQGIAARMGIRADSVVGRNNEARLQKAQRTIERSRRQLTSK